MLTQAAEKDDGFFHGESIACEKGNWSAYSYSLHFT